MSLVQRPATAATAPADLQPALGTAVTPGAAHSPRQQAPRCETCEACAFDRAKQITVCDLTGAQVVLNWPGKPPQVCPRTMMALTETGHCDSERRENMVRPVLAQIMSRGKLGLWQRLTRERARRAMGPGGSRGG